MVPISTESQLLLTLEEKLRLTAWKHRYALASAGFTPEQAERLCFARWLYRVFRLNEWPTPERSTACSIRKASSGSTSTR